MLSKLDHFLARNQKRLFIGFLLLYLPISLGTLVYSPLPWYDETYMASIALEFNQTGKFTPGVAYHAVDGQEDLVYGPLFFLIISTVYQLFGFGVFQYRMVAWLSGMLVLWLTMKLFQSKTEKKGRGFLVFALMAIDPFYLRCTHEGRNDLTTIAFLLGSLWLFLRFTQKEKSDEEKSWLPILFSGLLTGLAVLTTPRIGILFFGYGLLWLQFFFRNKKRSISAFALWLVPILIPYLAWYLYAFENWEHFISFYTQKMVGYTRLGEHPYYIPKQQYPLILAGFASMLIGMLRLKKDFFHPLIIFSIVSVILFYLLVYDNGPYAVFIVPSFYLLLFFAGEPTRKKTVYDI
ncbi:glycosyltransferase family 39 protein [Flammeovirgaceae bacterium SG7u.111]|nr:glycosyltransferase family 39 protein [Flammeovirgaceae bacterium SG7u.132]WPO34756.1 glycosyltransferase family 39 protein [Flammeovirgaceae bacterium SG7u.111]